MEKNYLLKWKKKKATVSSNGQNVYFFRIFPSVSTVQARTLEVRVLTLSLCMIGIRRINHTKAAYARRQKNNDFSK